LENPFFHLQKYFLLKVENKVFAKNNNSRKKEKIFYFWTTNFSEI